MLKVPTFMFSVAYNKGSTKLQTDFKNLEAFLQGLPEERKFVLHGCLSH